MTQTQVHEALSVLDQVYDAWVANDADALVARGLVRDRTEAFAGLLSSRGPYYVRHHAPHPVDAVRLVVEAGGVPVMAHPLARKRGRVVDDEVIEEMADAGLAGLEVDHRDNDPQAREHLRHLADRLDLLVTGSSGSVGSALVAGLPDAGWTVRLLDLVPPPHPPGRPERRGRPASSASPKTCSPA